jgi:hypothetical protein
MAPLRSGGTSAVAWDRSPGNYWKPRTATESPQYLLGTTESYGIHTLPNRHRLPHDRDMRPLATITNQQRQLPTGARMTCLRRHARSVESVRERRLEWMGWRSPAGDEGNSMLPPIKPSGHQ